ncbi:hypothetical protein ymoll0001_38750 [Yersinia mollaretii ATCC 43969]|uniref:Uncharacterized protein n=1 Tax=Yersinia mollaretii (strain ATCC 43969 / DSM 18520 / CIP 103324 / CNY 7263 / WAIP 204) TaxID=349967 RepID=A0ABP2EBR6_YERMW|nr:hypothetical protein ymoll0001_38750 [Yersinia mollaretii ATCC 43969]
MKIAVRAGVEIYISSSIFFRNKENNSHYIKVLKTDNNTDKKILDWNLFVLI